MFGVGGERRRGPGPGPGWYGAMRFGIGMLGMARVRTGFRGEERRGKQPEAIDSIHGIG